MEYELYKLKFKTAVHLGQGRLEEGAEVFHADTLFSALCFEALNLGGEALLKTLVEAAEEGKIKISGGLPYIGDTYYIPKPMIPVTTEASNSVDKKAMKNLTYIPIQQIGEYLNGKLDPTVYVEALSNLGKKDVRTGVGLSTLGENDLFYVETYCFEEDAGLYILVGYDREEERYLMGDLIEALGYSGIGGKRSSGLGQFEARLGDLPEGFSDRLKQESETRVMALNACLPKDNLEMVAKDASYRLIKRSGFVSSPTFAKEHQKKKTSYFFSPGSVFHRTFNGSIQEVSLGGNHPVYRYAMPMFLEV